MNLSEELSLSYYKTVAEIDAEHSVQLVQHTETKKFFVRKHLSIYKTEVYQSLQADPVRGIPAIEFLSKDENGLTVIEEYIPGDTLQELLERESSLSESKVVDWLLQLCHIVSALHHRNPPIIHRDIKPSNIIISSPDGIVHLLDLNAAKFATPEESRDTRLLGTAGFAAPEQYGFAPASPQSDLYAMGVLLNLLLTGKMPAEEIAGGRLNPVIRKCLEMDPANRYASVDDLALALQGNSTDFSGAETDGAASGKLYSTYKAHTDYASSWRRFLPPGFRHGSVLHMLLATIGYVLLFWTGLDLEVENVSPAALILNRITFIATGLIVILFSADYGGIQKRFPLTRSKNRFLRLLGIVLYDILFASLLILFLVLLEPLI